MKPIHKFAALVVFYAMTIFPPASAENLPFQLFGGQLEKLDRDLQDPFKQYVSLTLLGDSITWGMGVAGGGPILPRSGLLTDQRNNLTSPSWANLFHQYLGRRYFPGAIAGGELWPGASGGQNIVRYSKIVDVNPQSEFITRYGRWDKTPIGYDAYGGFNSYFHPDSLEFVMTGNAFSLVVTSARGGGKYEVLVDGRKLGVFDTDAIASISPIGKNVHVINFGMYMEDARIQIYRVPGTGIVEIDSVRLNKTFVVINQGINGSTSNRFIRFLIPSGAIPYSSKYVFLQLGTNDRGDTVKNTGQPPTPESFKERMGRLTSMVAALPGGKNMVLLCANAVTSGNQNLRFYFFDMPSVCAQIEATARANAIDYINQYPATKRLLDAGINAVPDGIHPNEIGHLVMFNNIVDALLHPGGNTKATGKVL